MDPAVREFLARNGAKGGRAGKGSELRSKLNEAAAKARWDKERRLARRRARRKAAAAPKPVAPPGSGTTASSP